MSLHAFDCRCVRTGLDHDLQLKMASKYDSGKAEAVRVWIEAVTKRSLPKDLHEALKSGVVLCELINGLWPGQFKHEEQAEVEPQAGRRRIGSECGCGGLPVLGFRSFFDDFGHPITRVQAPSARSTRDRCLSYSANALFSS